MRKEDKSLWSHVRRRQLLGVVREKTREEDLKKLGHRKRKKI